MRPTSIFCFRVFPCSRSEDRVLAEDSTGTVSPFLPVSALLPPFLDLPLWACDLFLGAVFCKGLVFIGLSFF